MMIIPRQLYISLVLLAASVTISAAQTDRPESGSPRRAQFSLSRVCAGYEACRVDFNFEWGSGAVRGNDGAEIPLTMSGYSAEPEAHLAMWSDPVAVPKGGGVLSFNWSMGLHPTREAAGDRPVVATHGSGTIEPERMLCSGASYLQGIQVVDAATGETLRTVAHRWIRSNGAITDTTIAQEERVDLTPFAGRSVRLRTLLCMWYYGPVRYSRTIARNPHYTASDYYAMPAGSSDAGSTMLK